ncbi:MAG: type II secretion system secretin GspD [Alphaproteobacteria bacterium]|nr:type II secretion system secretin GspD [Alphaproteobacteria bacterium]
MPGSESAPIRLEGGASGRTLAQMPSRTGDRDVGPTVVVRGRGEAIAPTRAASTTSPGGKGGDVTLNFAGADIHDVIAAVLGDTLKLNYVIDPEVTGPVTFNVSRPLARDEVLPTLEAVLNSRGATMVQSDGIIRVMPLRKEGKAGNAAPISREPASRSIGERTEVFPLRYVAATDMQHLLEKVLPPGQVVVADEPHHVLLVQGSPAELQIAEDTVRIFDIDQLSGMSMALVPLRNADPEALTVELKNIFDATRKEADSNVIRFMAIPRLNAVMILTRSPHYLQEARNWIERLDRARNVNERKVYVYNLQYSKAVQVGQKLQGLLTGLDIQFKAPAAPAGEGTGAPGGADKAEAAAVPAPPPGGPAPPAPARGPQPLTTRAGGEAAGAAPADAQTAASDKGTGVRVEADEAHNALLISASARDYELIRQVLEGIDVPPLQVLIEVTVAEVALNDALNYGVQFFLNSGRGQALLTTGSSLTGVTPPVPGFALALTGANAQPKVVLDALSDVTQTRVISTPRLLVLSNQTARLQVGDVVPIITQSATSTVTSTPLVLNNVTYKETGVVLEVTPRVNASGYVTMDINQSVSDVVNTTTSSIDSPTIRQRRLTSTISVKSGDSILLGGLIQQQDNRDSSGIPILHDIPGLGILFGSHTNSAARTELIMFMTPHVVSNDAESSNLTQSVQRQFQDVLDTSTLVQPRIPTR